MASAASPTLSIAVETRRRACVLDSTLALSPYGLALAQRLSREVTLCVGRELWELLDNSADLLSRASLVAGGAPATGDHATLSSLEEAVRQWDVARAEKDLGGLHLFWIGDATGTSLLPPEIDAGIVPRFELLARALDARAGKERGDGARQGFEACLRDEIALTVALAPLHAFLLTLCDPPAEHESPVEPALCATLRRWGIPCHPVLGSWSQRMERELFEPLFVRAAVPELIWAGSLQLAAVHVVARRAAAIPSFGLPAELPDDLQVTDLELADDGWWDDAVAFWYPILGR